MLYEKCCYTLQDGDTRVCTVINSFSFCVKRADVYSTIWECTGTSVRIRRQ